MTQPNFSALPAIPNPEFLTRSLKTKFKAVDTARQDVEAKRAAVVEALQQARSQDLASFEPVRVSPIVALQSEYRFRQTFSEYVIAVLAEANPFRDQCTAEVQTAEEAIKGRLVDMGYAEPAGGVVTRGCYGPDWIARHPHVLAAKAKVDDMTAFIESQTQARHENDRQTAALAKRLETLRDAAVLAV